MSNRNYDELFIRGTNAQREKLEENEHKGGFTDIDINLAFKNMSKERDELSFAIAILELGIDVPCEINTQENGYKAICGEAADVANFAHMIILKCDKELEK